MYLKNWRGEELLDPVGNRIPVEYFHNCDRYGRIPYGEKSPIFHPNEEARIVEGVRVMPGRILGSPATVHPLPLRRRTILRQTRIR